MATYSSYREEREALAISLYREKVEPLLSEADAGKYVVVDLDSGDYEVDEYEFDAEIKLLDRHPGANLYPFWGGEPYRVVHLGAASLRFFPPHHTEPKETYSTEP